MKSRAKLTATTKIKQKSGKKSKRVFRTESAFSSKNGFVTRVWGPPLWHVLHTISFNYPTNPSPSERKHYKQFVLSLQSVLPCGACRDNLKRNLRELPLTDAALQSRDSFSRYVYALHEKVNTMLKKSSGLTYEDVRERYEHFRARCGKKSTRQTKEKRGCLDPVSGIDTKCVMKIVPLEDAAPSLFVEPTCLKKRK